MKQKYTRTTILLFCSVILIASNLRAPIVAVGPVIPEMTEHLPLTPVLIGLITTIPLLCFACGSSFMPGLSKIFGLEKTLLYSIVLLACGLFIRPLGNLFYLFLGSVIIGIAITTGNVLMPAFIKKVFPGKIGLVTAFYLVAMNLTSAIAVGFSIQMGEIGHLGWKSSIGIWGFLSVIAFFFWLPTLKVKSSDRINRTTGNAKTVWGSRLAWQISFFMGSQSVIFYVFATWYPAILQSWGMDAARAGWMLSYVQMGQVPMMIAGPLLAARQKKQTTLVGFSFVILLAGLILLMVWKTQFIVLSSVLIGVSVGLSFALATMFFVLRTRNVADAAALSGMSQSVGYFVAACYPPLFGLLYAWSRSWTLPLLSLLAIALFMLVSGIPAAKDRLIVDKL